MHFDTQLEYRHQVMQDFYENEMQRYKETSISQISKSAHFKEKISRVLAYSYFEGNDDAAYIAESLDLCKVNFFAILEDLEGFKREYIKDQELAQNF